MVARAPHHISLPFKDGAQLSFCPRCILHSFSHYFFYWHSLLATSINVERLFSCGRLLLSHVRSRLSVESTQALLCLGAWSHLGLVKNEDILKVGALPEVDNEDETEGGIVHLDWVSRPELCRACIYILSIPMGISIVGMPMGMILIVLINHTHTHWAGMGMCMGVGMGHAAPTCGCTLDEP